MLLVTKTPGARYVLETKPFAQEGDSTFHQARRLEEARGWTLTVQRLPLADPEDDPHQLLFQEQTALLHRLEHPAIPRVYDVGVTPEGCYLVLEPLSGLWLLDVSRRLRASGQWLPVTLVAQLGAVLGAALHHAWSRHGLAHGTVAPRNILLTSDGQVKLMGFGLRKLEGRWRSARAGLLAPDPGYRYFSPEQVLGQPSDTRGDVFSLGLVLHELLTGACPLGRGDILSTLKAVLEAPIPGVRQARPDVPEELEHVLALSLHRDLERRYPTAREMAEDLEAFVASSGAPPLAEQLLPLLRA
jgi:serine/threonine-protein kinase